MRRDPETLLKAMFAAAVAAADPKTRVPAHLPPPPKGRCVVIGAGKASAAMARAVEENWSGPLSGLVVTRYGHAVACDSVEIIEAGHPVPDENGLVAARRILATVAALGAEDLALCLISGGGSALLTLPADGLTLDDKQAVNRALLRSGATIGEMNCVRKHLSAIKGGRLAAAAAPARVVTLAISDVPGDDPAVIASGPTVADPTSAADALAVLRKYSIAGPAAVIGHLEGGAGESPKPGDSRLENSRVILVATPRTSLEAAAAVAREAGIMPMILGDAIEGESREVACEQAGIARKTETRGKPVVLLSGGETTVTLRGEGRGGPNTEFLLALALALDGAPGIHAIACDTDGIDGSEDNAGALIGPDTLARAQAAGVDLRAMLEDNDAWGAFSALGDLVVTGPTLTNVNDFRAILITG